MPAQRRISKLTRDSGDGEVMDWLTKKVDAPDSKRYQRGLEYLRRTGAGGKQLLSKLTPDARSVLLKMRDKAALQRQLTKAWVRGDIDAADIGRSTRRYDALDPDQRAEFEDLVDRTGSDGVRFIGQADDASFQAFMDADVDIDTKAVSIRRYADLNDGAQDTFQSLVRDGDLRDSWLSTVGSPTVYAADIEKATDTVEDIEQRGHVLEEFIADFYALGDVEGRDQAYQDTIEMYEEAGVAFTTNLMSWPPADEIIGFTMFLEKWASEPLPEDNLIVFDSIERVASKRREMDTILTSIDAEASDCP